MIGSLARRSALALGVAACALGAAPAGALTLPVPSPWPGGPGATAPVIDVDVCTALGGPTCEGGSGSDLACVDLVLLERAEADCDDGGLVSVPLPGGGLPADQSTGGQGISVNLEPVDVDVPGVLDTSVDLGAFAGGRGAMVEACAELGLAGEQVSCPAPTRTDDERTGDLLDLPIDLDVPGLADVAAGVNVDLDGGGLDADVCLDVKLLGGSAKCPDGAQGPDGDGPGGRQDGTKDDDRDGAAGGNDDTGDTDDTGETSTGSDGRPGATSTNTSATLPFTGAGVGALAVAGAALVAGGRLVRRLGAR